MLIERVYIVCNKQDLYFANVSVASIRHWNKTVPLTLIKDESCGTFSTTHLQEYFGVNIAKTTLRNMGYYVKLWPFIESVKHERIMIVDADTVWMCDMALLLKDETADVLVDGYNPPQLDAEMRKWYFKKENLLKILPEYLYPGFLFNVGQFVINSKSFQPSDFVPYISWEENPIPIHKNIFFYEQGILNAILAEKIRQKKLTVSCTTMHRWGWSLEVQSIKKEILRSTKGLPFLIHWYGNKYALLSILPSGNILLAYEKEYFLQCGKSISAWYFARLGRTLKQPHRYAWHLVKKLTGKIKNR